MSELTPEERRAVEAAKAWVETDDTPAEERMGDEIGHTNDRKSDWDLGTYGFACGHLSGFRAGVEAAIVPVAKARDGYQEVGLYFEAALLNEMCEAIRALLAQEDEHGP